jgi:hypothetical protein
MAEAISKNARTSGSKTLKFLCPCGGEVKMVSVFTNGKLLGKARCDKCNREERKPSNFKA